MKRIEYTIWWPSRRRQQSIENTLANLDLHNNTKFLVEGNVNEYALQQAARHAHNNGLVYYATLLEGDIPVNFLEMNKDFFRVGFLDESLLNYMTYDFHGVDGKKLFLQNVFHWDFDKQTGDKVKMTEYNFTREGHLTIVEIDYKTNEQITNKAKNLVDVSANWEAYPEFGEYENLTKKERGLLKA